MNLLRLGMLDFDVILGIDWLSPCRVVLDYYAKAAMLALRGMPRIEWRGSMDYVPSRVVSFLKTQQIARKGCLSYLAFMMDVSAETPAINPVLVMRDLSGCVSCC